MMLWVTYYLQKDRSKSKSGWGDWGHGCNEEYVEGKVNVSLGAMIGHV